MKGIVLDCLKHLVVDNFGAGKWEKIREESSDAAARDLALVDDVEDGEALAMFGIACQKTGLTFQQACDAFGAYWVGDYIPKRFPQFFGGVSSIREFLLRLDGVHEAVPTIISGAKPPRHTYDWKDEKTLVMTYNSPRDLIELFDGAVRGVAIHFDETIETKILDRKHVEIRFGV